MVIGVFNNPNSSDTIQNIPRQFRLVFQVACLNRGTLTNNLRSRQKNNPFEKPDDVMMNAFLRTTSRKNTVVMEV